MTQTVGKGKSKGMAKGRQAADKAQANAERVAQLNADQGNEPQLLPSQMSRPQLVAYLKAHNAYAGHSRDGMEGLVAAAQQVRYGSGEGDGFSDWQAANGEHVTATMGTDEVVGAVSAELAVAAPEAAEGKAERLQLAKAEHKALQAWITDGEKPPKPATPNLDAINAEHAAKATSTKPAAKAAKAPAAAKAVADDHPLLRYTDAKLVGKKVDADLGLVHSIDATGLVRVHKATCKPALPALAKWPERVYAAACCKPRTPGAEARTKYVPPSKRAATA